MMMTCLKEKGKRSENSVDVLEELGKCWNIYMHLSTDKADLYSALMDQHAFE